MLFCGHPEKFLDCQSADAAPLESGMKTKISTKKRAHFYFSFLLLLLLKHGWILGTMFCNLMGCGLLWEQIAGVCFALQSYISSWRASLTTRSSEPLQHSNYVKYSESFRGKRSSFISSVNRGAAVQILSFAEGYDGFWDN